MLCYVTLRCVMLCYVMLCYVMFCYIIFPYTYFKDEKTNAQRGEALA